MLHFARDYETEEQIEDCYNILKSRTDLDSPYRTIEVDPSSPEARFRDIVRVKLVSVMHSLGLESHTLEVALNFIDRALPSWDMELKRQKFYGCVSLFLSIKLNEVNQFRWADYYQYFYDFCPGYTAADVKLVERKLLHHIRHCLHPSTISAFIFMFVYRLQGVADDVKMNIVNDACVFIFTTGALKIDHQPYVLALAILRLVVRNGAYDTLRAGDNPSHVSHRSILEIANRDFIRGLIPKASYIEDVRDALRQICEPKQHFRARMGSTSTSRNRAIHRSVSSSSTIVGSTTRNNTIVQHRSRSSVEISANRIENNIRQQTRGSIEETNDRRSNESVAGNAQQSDVGLLSSQVEGGDFGVPSSSISNQSSTNGVSISSQNKRKRGEPIETPANTADGIDQQFSTESGRLPNPSVDRSLSVSELHIRITDEASNERPQFDSGLDGTELQTDSCNSSADTERFSYCPHDRRRSGRVAARTRSNAWNHHVEKHD